jgi:hypothetical protein
MLYVYAGFGELLNRCSFNNYNQIYIVKFGFCDELESWEDRFNDGFKNKDTGAKESLSLALYKDWRRIATTKVVDWNKACPGLEAPLKQWAKTKFGDVRIAATLKKEVLDAHEKWKPGTTANKNGLGELRYIPLEAVPNLCSLMREDGINDPLADDVIRQLGRFLEDELERFVGSLGLKRVAP